MHTRNATLLSFSGWTKATVRQKRHVCLLKIIWGGDFPQAGFHTPDLLGVLGDGAIAGEFSTASNIVDHFLGPLFRVLLRGDV